MTAQFWADTVERAVRTLAQALIAVLSAGPVGLLDVPWLAALSTAGLAALLSVLMSVATRSTGEPTTPSVL